MCLGMAGIRPGTVSLNLVFAHPLILVPHGMITQLGEVGQNKGRLVLGWNVQSTVRIQTLHGLLRSTAAHVVFMPAVSQLVTDT